MCVTDVVIAAQPFVRTEGLAFHGSERSFINVGTWNVPTRCEAGLVENHGPFTIRNGTVTMTDDEMTGCLADVYAVVAVGGMAHDSFVLFVEGIHGVPGERNACLQIARVRGQVDVSPCSSRRALLARLDGIPGCEPKIG